MSLTISSTEKKRVVEVLEAWDGEGPEELATKVIQAFMEVRDSRTQKVVVIFQPGHPTAARAVGVYPTMLQAEKALTSGNFMVLNDEKVALLPYYPTGDILEDDWSE